jgi:hypothetical protein
MSVNERDLIANLLAIRTTIDNTLRLIGGVEETPQTTNDPETCGHPNRKAMMGGHYFCPDCKAEWKESDE